MKPAFQLGTVMLVLAGTLVGRAQEFGDERPPPPFEMSLPEAPELDEPPGPPPGPKRPVDIWMDRLHRRNPEEFQRIQQLRHRDPEAFRMELASRLGRERLRRITGAHPRLRIFLESLPEPERRDVLEALVRAFRPEGPPPDAPGAELFRLREEIARLAAEFRQADDPGKREQLKIELRGKLGELFDAREQARAHHIERIKTEVSELERIMEIRRARRAEILERRLRELTE